MAQVIVARVVLTVLAISLAIGLGMQDWPGRRRRARPSSFTAT